MDHNHWREVKHPQSPCFPVWQIQAQPVLLIDQQQQSNQNPIHQKMHPQPSGSNPYQILHSGLDLLPCHHHHHHSQALLHWPHPFQSPCSLGFGIQLHQQRHSNSTLVSQNHQQKLVVEQITTWIINRSLWWSSKVQFQIRFPVLLLILQFQTLIQIFGI
ncbi:unnamed protein product, partial [Vitis vinifera]